MSGMYNVVFGQNPMSAAILAAVGLTPEQVDRFRDAFVTKADEVVVYTRTGQEGQNAALQSNPHYLRTVVDTRDNTYCTLYFRLPDGAAEALRPMAIDWDPDARWAEALAKLEAGQPLDEATKARVKPVLDSLLGSLTGTPNSKNGLIMLEVGLGPDGKAFIKPMDNDSKDGGDDLDPGPSPAVKAVIDEGPAASAVLAAELLSKLIRVLPTPPTDGKTRLQTMAAIVIGARAFSKFVDRTFATDAYPPDVAAKLDGMAQMLLDRVVPEEPENSMEALLSKLRSMGIKVPDGAPGAASPSSPASPDTDEPTHDPLT